ncbi:ion transporter [Telmatospirillum siberiense]|uniref:Ion transporter n=2 Tax=Telmatospirillum siberiense TaxID=382514 RepID=A0A2N3PTV3_9PROT|nr:ion transporter [Telmatospirillum siberiense]
MTPAASANTPRRATRYRKVRRRVYHMLGGEGHSDPWVKLVDYALVSLITVNCIFSVLESVENLAIVHGHIFHAFDRFSVAIFSVEYVLRVWTAVEINQPRFRHPFFGRLHFIFTPMAIVDLVAIVPFYLGFFFDVDLRAMRVLRLLRVFKLSRYSQAMGIMVDVLRQEARSIGAMLFVFLVILVFVSSLMYMLEHPAQPHVFADIPSAMWWAVVTMTTLGYGDMIPATALGRVVGACTAVIGVGMIALPAGVLASGFSEQLRQRREEYLETVDKVVRDGRVTRREKRLLEETRAALGLTPEEAARILEYGVKGGQLHCPHCGEPIHRNPLG